MESASHILQLQKPILLVSRAVVVAREAMVEAKVVVELQDLQLQEYVVRVLHDLPLVPFRHHRVRQVVVRENDQLSAVIVVQVPSV